MRKKILFGILATATILIVTIIGCTKTSNSFSLNSITAGGVDLNTATAPSGVPFNATITATFSSDVNATTATSANIQLLDYAANVIPTTISASGPTVTIMPTVKLGSGTIYTLSISALFAGANGTVLGAVTRSFKTTGAFTPAGQVAYWNFEGNANDQIGSFSPAGTANVIDITYAAGRNTSAGQAAVFNGTTSLIEIPNGDQLLNCTDFSLSFWVNVDSALQSDQFVMGLAGWNGFQFEINNHGNAMLGECKLAAQYSLSGGTTASQDLWFNGAATNSTLANGGWQGWTYCKDLTTNGTGVKSLLNKVWANVVCTYDATTKLGTIYINGVKMKQQDFNLYGTTHPLYNATGLKINSAVVNKNFVFGFIQDKGNPSITDSWADETITTNGHFKGMLDDVAIYHRVLTTTEIGLMYASTK